MSFDFIETKLAARLDNGLYRKPSVIEGQQGRFLRFNDKSYVNFSSNDYLGLASDSKIIDAWQEGARLFGVGSGGSYLVTGHNQAHQDLTDQLKSWLGVKAVALFSSGYAANQAIIKLLLGKNDFLIQDKLNHASLIEAGAFADCKMARFKHNDMNHLRKVITKPNQANNQLIISEGVFSMDGDRAPIAEINKLAIENKAWLMIDDAHGLGVLGKQGKGSVVASGLDNDDLPIYMATFGKALGVGGAFVAGSPQFIDYLINFSKPYIYTTGLPPAMAYCIAQSASIVETEDWRREKLQDLIAYFRQLALIHQIKLGHSHTAIQPIIIGDAKKTVVLVEQLKALGFWTTAIRPPTVPYNSARLRITLTVNHQKKDIDGLIQAISTHMDSV